MPSEKITSIDAISVFIRVNGKSFLAPIDPASSELFVAMLGCYQTGTPKNPHLVLLPDGVTEHVNAAGRALIAAAKA